MSRSEDLKSSIKKYLDKLIRQSQMNFNDIQLPIDKLLEPTSGRTQVHNSFMLYCKDRASIRPEIILNTYHKCGISENIEAQNIQYILNINVISQHIIVKIYKDLLQL
jgi:hypothetical protein